MHRRQREHDCACNLRVRLFRHLGKAQHIIHAKQHVIDPERADAVGAQPPHPEVHQRRWGDAESDVGIGTQARPQRSVGHRGDQQVEPFPVVLLAIAGQHVEHAAAGQVDGNEAGAVEDRRNRQGHASTHAQAPKALLPVAHRFVEKFNVCHWASLARRPRRIAQCLISFAECRKAPGRLRPVRLRPRRPA